MNSTSSLLQTGLLEFMHALGEINNKLILVGGFGLHLKQMHIQSEEKRTLLSELPVSRSTQDLDIMLELSVLIDQNLFKKVRDTLLELNFEVVEYNKSWQWIKKISNYMGYDSGNRHFEIVIDILTGPPDDVAKQLKWNPKKDPRRARPKGGRRMGLHARPNTEALNFEDYNIIIPISGQLLNNSTYSTEVRVASPFTYLLMKLFAFRDQYNNKNKDNGSHHALDLYRIVALMLEDEYEYTIQKVKEMYDYPTVITAKEIAKEFFFDENSFGMIRMQEHINFTKNLDRKSFREVIREIFETPV